MANDKNKGVLTLLKDWSSLVMSIGSVLFAVVIMYADVQKLKKDVDDLKSNAVEQVMVNQTVHILQLKVQNTEKAQDKLDDRFSRIETALSNIQVGVGRLEERMSKK